jgi:hypothetical protein
MLENTKVYHDIVHWSEENIKINTSDNILSNLALYPRQKEILTDWNNNRFNILVSSRQVGLTTMILADIIYHATTTPNLMIAVLIPKEVQARDFLERVSANINDPTHKTRNYIRFANGSKIICQTHSANSMRGHSLDRVYLMDYDYISKGEQYDIIPAIIPCISRSKNRSLIIASTPNPKRNSVPHGILNLYYYAILGKNPYRAEKFYWNEIPGRDDKWLAGVMDCLGDNKAEIFKYEFNCGE